MDSNKLVIDPEVIDSLRGIEGTDGMSLLDEMIELFTEDSSKRIASLRDALARSDIREIAEVAHSLKGSCSNFGAGRLEEACKRLELQAKRGDLGGADELIETVAAEFERASKALEAERG